MRWFSQEVHPHEPALRSYLRRAFPAVRDIDDLVQDSYLRILRTCRRPPILSPRAFLFTVARNLALDGIRRRRRSPIENSGDLTGLSVPDARADVTRAVGQEERIRRLREAIERLPDRCREVVVLRQLRLLSQREVAHRLGISEKGVEIQLRRGRSRCRSYLRRHGVEDNL